MSLERRRPDVSGEVYKGNYKRGDKEVKGSVAFWIDEGNFGSKFPVLTGNIQVEGEKFRVDAWLHGWKLVRDVEPEAVAVKGKSK